MDVVQLLNKKHELVHKGWFEKILQSYPKDTRVFWAKGKDPHANPVGQTFSKGTKEIVSLVLCQREVDWDKICSILEQVIKIRAIHDFTPAQAVSFVFDLKEVVWDVLSEDLTEISHYQKLKIFEKRIDQLVLFAFDIYSKCVQRLCQIRVDEVKRQVYTIIRRSNMIVEADSGDQAGDLQTLLVPAGKNNVDTK